MRPKRVLTLQQIVLSKNPIQFDHQQMRVLTLQQIVLSKNNQRAAKLNAQVLTLQQIVLSKNIRRYVREAFRRFDFTTNCSF